MYTGFDVHTRSFPFNRFSQLMVQLTLWSIQQTGFTEFRLRQHSVSVILRIEMRNIAQVWMHASKKQRSRYMFSILIALHKITTIAISFNSGWICTARWWFRGVHPPQRPGRRIPPCLVWHMTYIFSGIPSRLRSLGECRKLSQRDLGRSPSLKRCFDVLYAILCIFSNVG